MPGDEARAVALVTHVFTFLPIAILGWYSLHTEGLSLLEVMRRSARTRDRAEADGLSELGGEEVGGEEVSGETVAGETQGAP